jgi:interleukin-1 receptor-associated kinase 1
MATHEGGATALFHDVDWEEVRKATNNFAADSQIGTGAGSVVYGGVLRGTPVAIKLFQQTSPEMRLWDLIEMFETEVDMLSEFDHPCIVRILASVTAPERCIILEKLYSTVEERLATDGCPSMGWQQRLNVAAQTAQGLDYLHSMSLVHRDVKTSNLLIDDRGQTKIADFGTCIEMFENNPAPSSDTVRLVGSDEYLAPDYRTDGLVDMTVDTYAFGIVLLELLSGLSPLECAKIANQRAQIDSEGGDTVLDSTALWPPAVAQALLSLAQQCLHQSREHRCAMQEVTSTLEKVRAAHTTMKSSISQEVEAPTPDQLIEQQPTIEQQVLLQDSKFDAQAAAVQFLEAEQRREEAARAEQQQGANQGATLHTQQQQEMHQQKQAPVMQQQQATQPAEHPAKQRETRQETQRETQRETQQETQQETQRETQPNPTPVRPSVQQEVQEEEQEETQQEAKPEKKKRSKWLQRVQQHREEQAELQRRQTEAHKRQQEIEAPTAWRAKAATRPPPPAPPLRFAPVLPWGTTNPAITGTGWFGGTLSATATVGIVAAGSLAALLGPRAAASTARWGMRSTTRGAR